MITREAAGRLSGLIENKHFIFSEMRKRDYFLVHGADSRHPTKQQLITYLSDWRRNIIMNTKRSDWSYLTLGAQRKSHRSNSGLKLFIC